MPVPRDLQKEQQALKTFVSNYKKTPSSKEDWDKLHALAYPTPAQMPDEFKQVIQSTQPAAGLGTVPNTPATVGVGAGTAGPGGTLSQTVAGSNLQQLSSNVGTAQADMNKVSQPNAALQVLQEAIRAKAGFSDRSIGTPNLFSSLGVTGMGALGSAIAAQHDILAGDSVNFQNAISTMAGTYKDMAIMAKTKYDQAYTQWKDEADRLQKVQDNLQQHKDAIDTLQQQYQNSLKLEQWKRNNPDLADIIKAKDADIDPVTGKPIASDQGSVSFRTNNPGNIKWGDYAKSLGAVDSGITATDGGTFAKFPDLKAGTEAQKSLLKGANYANLTVDQAMKRWSNNGYGAEIEPSIPATTLMKDLTPVQLDTLAQSQQRAEGFSAPGVGGSSGSGANDFLVRNLKAAMGGNASDKDAANVKKFYNDQVAKGVTDERQIFNALINFVIKKPEDMEIADKIRGVVTQNLPANQTFKDAGAVDYANFINDGKYDLAIRKAELFAYNKAKSEDPNNYISEGTVKVTLQRSNELAALVAKLDATGKNPIGNFPGTISEWLGKFKGKEATDIAGKATKIVAELQKDLLGSAVTETERGFLKPLLPELGDKPENYLTKLGNLKANSLEKLNGIRETHGMPAADEGAILDQKNKVKLYNGEEVTNDYKAPSGTKYNLPH